MSLALTLAGRPLPLIHDIKLGNIPSLSAIINLLGIQARLMNS